VQRPATQVWSAVHATPALAPVHEPVAPQFVRLDEGSTHEVPHARSGGSHAHTPKTQLLPVPHATPPVQLVPVAPQYVSLVFGLTHAPPQRSVPDWHVHTPFEQPAPGGQTVPPVQFPVAPQ
jgi:hypothetical protein